MSLFIHRALSYQSVSSYILIRSLKMRTIKWRRIIPRREKGCSVWSWGPGNLSAQSASHNARG